MSFRVRNLLPTISSISGSPFNPNGDGVRDSVTVHYALPDTETASWSVVNSAGATIRGPLALGKLAKGAHSFVWNGKDKAVKAVFGGTYTIVVATTGPWNGQTLQGRASRNVVVDRSAPLINQVNGAGTTWYSGGYASNLSQLDVSVFLSEARNGRAHDSDDGWRIRPHAHCGAFGRRVPHDLEGR